MVARSAGELGLVAARRPAGMPVRTSHRQRDGRQAQRDGQPAHDRLEHGLAQEKRPAELAFHDLGEPDAKLHGERPVEPQPHPQPLDGVGRGFHPEQDRRRVAGDQPDERKGNDPHDEPGGDKQHEPAGNVLPHRRPVP